MRRLRVRATYRRSVHLRPLVVRTDFASCYQDQQDRRQTIPALHKHPHATFRGSNTGAGGFFFSLPRCARRSTTSKLTGIRKIARREAASIPPMTAVPSTRREIAPAPAALHSGTQPRMNAKAVINIGLNRSFAAISAESSIDLPLSNSIFANSTIRMAFLAASPISMTSPICAYTLFSRPRIHRTHRAPKTATGVPSSTLKGSDQLSYCAARIRNTNSRDMAKITEEDTPSTAFFSWNDMPR